MDRIMTEDILDPFLFHWHASDPAAPGRWLQPNIPNYTSPPLEDAIQATPEAYRSDDVINDARAAAAAGNCTVDGNRCHIPFVPPSGVFEVSKVGVIFYCGGLVDPRGYSPIAQTLANRYGFPVVLPIFDRDIAFLGPDGGCDSGRINLARAEFENVERWVLAGHSLGGVAAMVDAWTHLYGNSNSSSSSNYTDETSVVGGLAMLAADVQNVGCGDTDFSTTNFPMAYVTASLDGILNTTRSEMNTWRLSNHTLVLDIFGGNHGQFGSYNDSERTALFIQADGVATIPPQVQWDLTTASIYHVASRMNVSLPEFLGDNLECPQQQSSSSRATCSPNAYLMWMWAPFALVVWLLQKS